MAVIHWFKSEITNKLNLASFLKNECSSIDGQANWNMTASRRGNLGEKLKIVCGLELGGPHGYVYKNFWPA